MLSNKKLNILIFAARYPGYGGIERVTTQLANHWSKRHKVIIASLCQQDETLLCLLSSDVKYYKFPYGGVKMSDENVFFLYELIERECIDVLIYQDSYFPCHYLLKNIRKNGLKIIEVEHCSPNAFEKEFQLTKGSGAIERLKGWISYKKSAKAEMSNRQLLYDVCDRYVLLAEEYIPICQRLGKISDNSKFRVIGNPISIKTTNINLEAKNNECVFVGRFDQVKGLDRLMRVWSKVEAVNGHWHLTLVGDGMTMSDVKNMIELFGLKRVNLEGYQYNVTEYYKRSKIYCMCSSYEGFPMVLPEAMSYGVVPIAYNTFEAYNAIISNGNCGCSIKPYDEDAYVSQLVSLMEDEARLKAMQKACLERAVAFSPEVIFSQWDTLFSELI